MKIMTIALTGAAMLAMASPAQAQEVKAMKGDAAETVQMFMVNIPPPHRAEFMERVETMRKIRKDAGLAPMTMLETMNGSHDFVFMAPVEGGMAALDWEISPADAKYRTAAAKHFGSVEAAQKWNARWYEITGGRPTWVYAKKR